MTKVAICIPTVDRPGSVGALIENLAEQALMPDVLVVVDGSTAPETERICSDFRPALSVDLLYERSSRGLTRQRRRAIKIVRDRDAAIDYICFLDDDVRLDRAFLSTIVGFMESADGRAYGGVAGYDIANWGLPFDRREKFYEKVGIFDELRAGRWLYCGAFLELDRLQPLDGVYDTDFIPGGLTVWRTAVFDGFLPPEQVGNYRAEDKHLSLRIAAEYKIGVHGAAHARHLHEPGGRPHRLAAAFRKPRVMAHLILACERRRPLRRYAAFLCFEPFDTLLHAIISIVRAHFADLPAIAATGLGWVSCIVWPPRKWASERKADMTFVSTSQAASHRTDVP